MKPKRSEIVQRKNELANTFYALSDPNRIRILNALTLKDETNATKLINDVNCKQATLSHHLKLLNKNGLINVRKSGKNTFYSINQPRLDELKDFIDTVSTDYGYMWYKGHFKEYQEKEKAKEWVPRCW